MAGLMDLITAVKNTSSFGGSGEGGDIYKKLIGLDSSELRNLGNKMYPDLEGGSRHHATAANLLTSQLAPGFGTAGAVILPQLLGLGVEGGEALMTGGRTLTDPALRADTLNDLKANLQGSLEAAGLSLGDLLR